MNYAELITAKRDYKYSANLCFDLRNENRLAEFIPDITTTEILGEYLYGIISKTNVHSRILYGSYGTGKSHLLTVLCALLGQINTDGKAFESFLESLAEYDAELAGYIRLFVSNQKPYFVVPVYSDHNEFDRCISFSLKKEFANRHIDVCFKSSFQEALELLETWENGRESAGRLNEIVNDMNIDLEDLKNGLCYYRDEDEKTFREIFSRMTFGATFISQSGSLSDDLDTAGRLIADDYQGIVFVFDEFGRYLEDQREKIRVKSIQDLAEYCDHSDYNTHVILVSHKQLSLYTEKMGKGLNEEWKKVEGRFRATSVNARYDQCLSLIPHIIPKTDKWQVFSAKFEKELQQLSGRAYDFKGFLHPGDGRNPFLDGFPLHPVSLFVLERLSKRVAQNERTFFTYLVSDEENALFKQLEQFDTQEFHFVGLDLIYDYFEQNIRSYYRTDEIYETYKKLQYALNKLRSDGPVRTQIKILKTIAVINMIADTTVLASDRVTLKYVTDERETVIDEVIDQLEQMKIIKFMRQYGYYDFFDSSVYDFDAMIEDKIRGITMEMVITELNQHFINFVVYPYEYNFRYHMKRIFIPVFIQNQKLNKNTILKMVPGYYDGLLLMVFDSDFIESAYKNPDDLPDRTILLVNTSPGNLILEVKRYIATKYFYAMREELIEKDPAAVRELELYLEEQKSIIFDIILQWRSFRLTEIVTYIGGKKKTVTDGKVLSQEASALMFRTFYKTIIVNNDVVNKNNISGTIRSSRKKVIAAIIGEQGSMGQFSPMSPEHTMIRSVLQKNGFTRRSDGIEQNLFPQEAGTLYGKCSGKYVKLQITGFFRECTKNKKPLIELIRVLKQEPFGLRDGYIPLLLADGLKEYQNVGIYFHNDEKEYSSEELLKACEKPEDYYISLGNWTKEQNEYIDGLEDIFKSYLTKNPGNRLKELLEAMNVHYASLPKFARVTEKYVSEPAKRYRRIMSISHKDYHQFFFQALPELEGDLVSLLQLIRHICRELEHALPDQNKEVENSLREILETGPEDPLASGLVKKYDAGWVQKKTYHITDYQTNALLKYVQTLSPEEESKKVIENLTRIVAGFETDYWNDSTIEDFQNGLRQIADHLNSSSEENERLTDSEFQLIVKSSEGESVISTFHKCEMSQNGQIMFNKIKSTIHSFGQSISYEEKMVILAQLLSDL